MVIANDDLVLYKGIQVKVKKIFLHTVYLKYSVVTLEYEDGSSTIISLDEFTHLSRIENVG